MTAAFHCSNRLRRAQEARFMPAVCSLSLLLGLFNTALCPASAGESAQAEKQQKIAVAAQASQAAAGKPLKGGVRYDVCPFKEDGSTETIPQGTELNLTVTANLNSELNQVGDEIRAEVTTDLRDDKKVLLPGKWQVVGKIERVEKQKRMGRDGYIEIHFQKLVSPDGKWVVPLDASASTKESTTKTVTKQVVTTAGYTTVGAIGGSILSVQLTGLPVAVATHGLSVAVGAAAGAGLGVAAALHRKGDILSAVPGDEIKIKLPGAITIPAFNQDVVPSKAPKPALKDVELAVRESHFEPFPFGDKKSRLLVVNFSVENNSTSKISFSNIAVVCNHNHSYLPYCASPSFFKERAKTVGPNAVQEATLTFQVGSPKLKYSLVILDRSNTNILSEVAIN